MRNIFVLSRVTLVLVISGLLLSSCGYKITEPVDTKTIIQKSTPNTEVKQKDVVSITQSKNESEEVKIPITKTRYDLRDYPNFLIQDGVFKGVLVIGDKAPSADVISITDIAMSLSYSVGNGGYPIAIGETKLASELDNIKSKNAILVGSPCINKGIADLFPKFDSSKCVDDHTYSGILKNKGIILVVENNGNMQIIVTGYSQTNINHASKVLLNYKYYKLEGNSIIINEDGTVEGIEKVETPNDCPQLKEINVFEWRSILGSDYMRLNNSYNGVNLQGYNVTWSFYVQCEKGKDKGDNLNWWYCGKYYDPLLDFIHLKKMIINNNGEIIEIINKKAHNIYNENFEFIKTECVE